MGTKGWSDTKKLQNEVILEKFCRQVGEVSWARGDLESFRVLISSAAHNTVGIAST